MGLGRIGLPLATQFSTNSKISIIGVDRDESRVDALNDGDLDFLTEPGIRSLLERARNERRLSFTTDLPTAVQHSSVIVVLVPLIVDDQGEPAFSNIDSVTATIGEFLTPGSLVIYETTLPVGTTTGRFKPLLEQNSGMTCGLDFYLCFSPERVLTGRVLEDLTRYPKVLGGNDKASLSRGIEFYEAVLSFRPRDDLPRPNGVWPMHSCEAAEMVKLVETTYRDVNIALANEFAIAAESAGVDLHSVIEACNSQPYSHVHRPGIAVGGHCIPVYPRLFLSTFPDSPLVRQAREVNVAMPGRALQRILGTRGDWSGVQVVILGAGFRGNTGELSFSGIYEICERLTEIGARVRVHDPHLSDAALEREGFVPFTRGNASTVAILQADHDEYREWSCSDIPGVESVYDGRGILRQDQWAPARLFRIGVASSHPE